MPVRLAPRTPFQGVARHPNAPTPPENLPPVKPGEPIPATGGLLHALGKVAPPPKPVPPLKPSAPENHVPVPVLQQQGFNGGIQEFNQRVQAVVDSHTRAYGKPPSPGLTLDVAKSPLEPPDFDKLFTVPTNPLAARARGTLTSQPPESTLVVRHDGYVERNNPAAAQTIAEATPANTLSKYQSLQSQHPWVAMGMIPGLNSSQLEGFWGAVKYAQNNPAAAPLTVGGETLAQYKRETLLSEGLTGTRLGENPALGGFAPYGHVPDQKALNAAQSGQFSKEQVVRGATTVLQAQKQLQQVAPDFFGDLPATGYINQDWSKALGQYQTTPQYFRQQTASLAKDNHFGSNTGAFISAWKSKQSAIKKYPFLATFLSHQPLALFDTKTHGAAWRNLLTGNTKGWGWADVPTWGTHALSATAGLAINEIAGTVDQAKQDSAFASAYMQAVLPKGLRPFPTIDPFFVGKGETEAEARQKAVAALKANPNWVRVFVPDYTGKGNEHLIGAVGNAAIDLALGGVKFTGEEIAAGDTARFAVSRYTNSKLDFSFNSLQKGDLGGAVKSMEGGIGAEKLATAFEDGVKNGTVTRAEFKAKANELYSYGHTSVNGEQINGSLFRSLRTSDLPTATKVGRAGQEARQKVRSIMDQFDKTVAGTKQQGITSHAVNFVSKVSQQFAKAAPSGSRRAISDTKTPDDLYNWARVELGDRTLAANLRDDFIRLRSKEDIQGISDLNDKLKQLWASAHPDTRLSATPLETAGPEIESESRTYLAFPKEIQGTANSINAALNNAGRYEREIIVGGSPLVFPFTPGFGESLFYKHAIADTTRRVIGGGGAGVFGVGRDLKETKAAVEAFAKDNPKALRQLGVNRDSAVAGEYRYITGQKPTDSMNFRTGEKIPLGKNIFGRTKTVKTSFTQQAAGGYLRRMVTSKALKAYQASTADDLSPLIHLIQNDRDLQNLMFKDARTFTPSTEWQKIPDGIQLPTGAEVAERANARYVRWPEGQVPKPVRFGGLTATDAAEALFKRYQEIDAAGQKVGMSSVLDDAQGLLIKKLGPSADAKLGKWIDDNGLDFPVRDGLVPRKQFDDPMQQWVGMLMAANKWNRGQMYDHVLYSAVKNLTKAGWSMEDAVPVATDLAKAQTVFHMLDFSNMLQVEQNFRWALPFVTKHRLYWSWVLKNAVRRPFLAAAVGNFGQYLDSKGNLDFNMYGRNFFIPVTRLFWANATELPATSPIVQFGARSVKGVVEGQGLPNAISNAVGSLVSTSGNVVTRDDQAEMWGAKLGLVASGHLKPSSDAVTAGLGPSQIKSFQEKVNEYSVFYHQEHGAWPTERDAVKHTLMSLAVQSAWNANLFLPIEWQDSGTTLSPAMKAKMQKYDQLVNPIKKRAYLAQHPDVALHFGVSQDPAVFLHNNRMWDQFNAASKQVAAERTALYNEVMKTGQFTPQTEAEMKRISAAWENTISQLQLEDAANWPGTAQFPKGEVSDGKVVTPGPWGIALEGDPHAARAFVHQAFPNIGKTQLDAHTVGQRITDLQNQLDIINKLKTDADAQRWGYASMNDARSAKSAITQQLAPFFAYPKNALSSIQSEYYNKFVGPYIKARDAKTAAVALLPTDQQDAARSALRAWKDAHDHPVKITSNGKTITFPSVVQIGWSTLPPDQKHLGLAQAVTGDWAHIASYEKTLLGVKTPADVSQGWSAYADAVREYSKNPSSPSLVSAQRVGLAKQIDKVYPGFYRDFLFAQQPKITRFKYTSLYKQMPDKTQFDQYITGPADQIVKAIKANGNSTYYSKAWRDYVETEVQPWLDSQPALKKELANYGPDFLNTLVSTSG